MPRPPDAPRRPFPTDPGLATVTAPPRSGSPVVNLAGIGLFVVGAVGVAALLRPNPAAVPAGPIGMPREQTPVVVIVPTDPAIAALVTALAPTPTLTPAPTEPPTVTPTPPPFVVACLPGAMKPGEPCKWPEPTMAPPETPTPLPTCETPIPGDRCRVQNVAVLRQQRRMGR